MRNTLVIAGKELQGYFVQPVAYVRLHLVAGIFRAAGAA